MNVLSRTHKIYYEKSFFFFFFLCSGGGVKDDYGGNGSVIKWEIILVFLLFVKVHLVMMGLQKAKA